MLTTTTLQPQYREITGAARAWAPTAVTATAVTAAAGTALAGFGSSVANRPTTGWSAICGKAMRHLPVFHDRWPLCSTT